MGMDHRTPSLVAFDSRSLRVRSVDYCRCNVRGPAQPRIKRNLFDGAGRAVKQWDARLWGQQQDDMSAPASLTTVYSLSDAELCTVSVDAGLQIDLPGLASEGLRGWDGRGTQRERIYDDLLRPVAVFEQGAAKLRQCVERLKYGYPDQNSRDHNQYGQLIRHDDPAGVVLLGSFSLTGQNLVQNRRFTLDAATPNWPVLEVDREPLLEPGDGELSTRRLGPLGDVLEQTDARGNRHRQNLALDGRLRESQLLLNDQSDWQSLVRDIRYNAEGQIEQQTAGNDVLTTLKYRPEDGRLMERHARRADQVLQALFYTYDPMGNVLSIEDTVQPPRYFANQRIEPISRFTYDSLYQLIEACGWEAGAPNQGPDSVGRLDPAAVSNYRQTYRYDESGNLVELTHVGAQNQGRQLKAARYSNRCLPYRNGESPTEEAIAAAFDARGNCVVLDEGRFLTWNLRNQLSVVIPVERASGLNDSEAYVYDGNGQRVRKIRSLQTNARPVVAEVRYLPGLELRTDTGTGEVLQVICVQTGLNSVSLLHWESPPPSGSNDHYRYAFSDHVGSFVLELTDDARIASRETFYPFGETAWSVETGFIHKTIRYAGKERDATGLYYFGYRYYVTWLQRWLNPDPGGAIDGHNRYRAMRNNPLVYRDRDGRRPEKSTGDRIYHELAEKNLVSPVQAAGMQPVRRYFENDPDPNVQAYRREIPRALAELGARDDSLLNTHQAHVIAAARTNTASPSGAVLYHSGELLSSAMNRVVGEALTSRIMGPMSVAFNSPVEDPQVLAGRRGAVAKTFQVGGQMLMHASHPAAQLVGAAGVAMGNLMEVSEAQTRVQYRLLSKPVNVGLAVVDDRPGVSFQSLNQGFPALPQPLFAGQPATPSALAQRLFAAAFDHSFDDAASAAVHSGIDVGGLRRLRRDSIDG